MKFLPTLLVGLSYGFFKPMMPKSFFGKSDLLEKLQEKLPSDYEYDINNVDYILDDIITSLGKGNLVFDLYSESIGGLRSAAVASSCSTKKLKEKNILAVLECPGNQGEEVLDGTPCRWQCQGSLEYGNRRKNNVKCQNGEWQGVKKVKCNDKCSWSDLELIQSNSEFSHCNKIKNFGQSRFRCKIDRKSKSTLGKSGAKCSCKNSRQNSGKCKWKEF